MGGFGKFLEKYHMEKWFQKENLVILVLAGILLIVISLPTKEENDRESNTNLYEESQEEVTVQESKEQMTEDYVSSLEKKLAQTLSKIKGAGNVHVMITLQESEELVVEKDILAQEEQTVYESEGDASVPYVIKTIYPKVAGVVVVAEGAGTGKVTQHITEAVQALFDIELHKIKVTGS